MQVIQRISGGIQLNQYINQYLKKTDIVNTVDKSRSIPGTNLSNKSTRIGKPTEIDIVKDNKDISNLSLLVYYLTCIPPDILCITCKNKRKKLRTLRLL